MVVGWIWITIRTLCYKAIPMKILVLAVVSLFSILISQQAWADPLLQCLYGNPEYPHISSSNLKKDANNFTIKTSATISCPPSIEPIIVTAQVTLEVSGPVGLWVPYEVGDAISKNIQGTGGLWRRGELFAVRTCVPGIYRGRLKL